MALILELALNTVLQAPHALMASKGVRTNTGAFHTTIERVGLADDVALVGGIVGGAGAVVPTPTAVASVV